MFAFYIDYNSKIPLYQQLYQEIINNIENGNLKKDYKMPSKRQLSLELRLSQNTIITVYELLKSEGYLYSLERKGYFVSATIIKHRSPKKEITKEEKIKTYKYNLTTSSVDSKIFPKITWTRITKQIILNSIYSLGSNKGDYNTREAISKYLFESRGIKSDPENIILGAGIEYLLPQILNIIPGSIAIENPGYKKIKQIIENNHVSYSYLNLEYDNIPEKTKMLYVTPSHQFPTGRIMSVSKRHKLLSWAQNDKYIIEDDYDSEYRFDGSIIKPLYSINNSNVIYLSTFSRTISPSLRIGFMILPNSLLESYQERYKSYANPISRLEQQVLSSFIDDGYYERHIRKAKTLYKKKRDLIVSLLKKYNLQFEISNIGLSLIVKLNSINQDRLKSLLLENDILISFISEYYYTDDYPCQIVLGFASIGYEDIPFAIDQLNQAIKKGAVKK